MYLMGPFFPYVTRITGTIFIVGVACLFDKCSGQSGLKATGTTDMMSIAFVNGSSRSNWADKERAVLLKTATLSNVLSGTTITVGVDPTSSVDPLFLTFDPISKYPNGGHIFSTLTSVAKQLGCNLAWKQLPPQGNMTADDVYVATSVKLVDIFAAFYIKERWDYIGKGIAATSMALSNEHLLVTTIDAPPAAGWWNFGIPFTNEMWLFLVLTLILQGFIQVLVLKRREVEEGQLPEHSLILNLFSAINSFAGEKVELKDSGAFMLMISGLNFFTFIISSSYLANYATTLYNASLPSPPLVTSMDDANANIVTLCVLAGDPTHSTATWLRGKYPLIRVRELPFPDYITSVGSDLCKGALVGRADWLYYKGLNSVNAGDALFFQPVAAGLDPRSMLLSNSYRFATALDYTDKCTNFLTKAFSLGLETVHQTVSIQASYEASIAKLQDFTTQWDSPQPSINLSLGIPEMIGVFIVGAAGFGLAIVIFIWSLFYVKYIEPRTQPYVDRAMNGIANVLPQRFRRKRDTTQGGGAQIDDIPEADNVHLDAVSSTSDDWPRDTHSSAHLVGNEPCRF